jgi:hypothetical protein
VKQKVRAAVIAGVAISLAAASGCAGKAEVSTVAQAPRTPADALRAALFASAADNTVYVTETISGRLESIRMSGMQQLSPLRVYESSTMDFSTVSALKLTEIYDGTDLYVKSSQFSALDGGKPWARIGPSNVAGADGMIQPLLDGARDQLPGAAIVPLLASRDLRRVGTATVDGARAAGYSGSLTASELDSMSQANGLAEDQIEQLQQSFLQNSTSAETVEAWIDSDNLPLRVTMVATTAVCRVITTIDKTRSGCWNRRLREAASPTKCSMRYRTPPA